jgi:hypothetical protein
MDIILLDVLIILLADIRKKCFGNRVSNGCGFSSSVLLSFLIKVGSSFLAVMS